MKGFVRQSGFTLIEVIIALAILALIGLGTTGILSSVIESDKLSTARFEQLQQLQRAMLAIERDLLQALPRHIRVNGESNKNVINGGRDVIESEADGMSFVRGGWHNPQLMLPRSTLQSVGYRLVEGNLERLYSNYVDNIIGHEPKVRVLLSNIEDFRLEFFVDPQGKLDEQSKWKESYIGSELPIAIAVTIESEVYGEVRREFALASNLQ